MLIEEAVDRAWDGLLPDLEKIRGLGRGLSDFIAETVDIAKVTAGRLDAAEISRDLRTPLESIIGYSQLLQEEAGEHGWGEAQADLQKIESAAKYLTSLIAAVLELATSYAAETLGVDAGGRELSPVATGPRAAAPGSESGSILVVDDNELDAEIMSRRLAPAGYTVVVATSGPMAIELLNSVFFDLILLDVLMPDPDGLATLRQIKESSVLREIPVIMLSVLDDVPVVVQCVEAGADDYLFKPVDAVLLRAKINAALEKKRLRNRELEYLRHVSAVTVAAAALENDAFDPDTLTQVAARDDSLGGLARVFERMAAELQAREQSLQRQVTRLKIQIDQVKLQREVAAITETEYFQSLRNRGRLMRELRD